MVLICFGTRPEWLKIKPLLETLSPSEYQILFTGQHTTLLTNEFTPNFEFKIPSRSTRLDDVINSCLANFPETECNSILVQGDTASAFGCALAAFHRKKKIYHLEAGLRSYNFEHPYPEEGYRQLISRLSSINFCPTELSKTNLLKENVQGKCYVVGNTALDNLVSYRDKTSYTDTVLVTLHRRENHNETERWFYEINLLAKKHKHINFILPLHPNPNVTRHKALLTHVNVVDPLIHSDLLEILTKCKLVITDSGGLQEEGSFLNKKIIVCRQTTERPEGIKTGHLYMCKEPNTLSEIFSKLYTDYYISSPCPYGDGFSSQKIKNILLQTS